MDHEGFLGGAYDTSFLEDQFALAEPDQGEYRHFAAIVATLLSHQQRQRVRISAPPRDEGDSNGAWKTDRGWKLAGRWEALGR